MFAKQLAVGLLLVLSLPAFAAAAENTANKKLLVIGQGPDGHPAGTHKFMADARVLAELLKTVDGVDVTVVKAVGLSNKKTSQKQLWDKLWDEGPGLIDKADGVVLLVSAGAKWMQSDPKLYAAFERLAKRGGGLTALHWSVGSKESKYIKGQLRLLGATRGGPKRKYAVLETDVCVLAPAHPVMRGMNNFRVHDEFYYRLDLLPIEQGNQPLLAAKIKGNDEVVAWAWQRPEGGRSFGYVGLHYHKLWRMPEYRRLIKQGVLWTLEIAIPPQGVDIELR